jgi:endonuclease/exonuclease/phosphatase family metal-dependent hydrolase
MPALNRAWLSIARVLMCGMRGIGYLAAWLGLLSSLCLPSEACAEPSPKARAGELKVLTYNVAGLPEGLSNVHPLETLPVVGGLLNRYDVALVQEDYAYPALLRTGIRLPYGTAPFERGQALHFGDGLSQFSKLPFGAVERMAWQACHGRIDSYFDCLTPKGLSMTRVEISPGISVDVYNVHLDAGPGDLDRAARAKQLDQLTAAVQNWSSNRAVIVGGDFNLTWGELRLLGRLADRTQLRDACQALRCPEPWRLDRVLTRSSKALRLTPRTWSIDRSFKDRRGRPLSDHLAVSVVVAWSAVTLPDAS